MDAIELNAALYAKMEEELTDFANWLLKQPPEVILNHAIEYAAKFDIVSIMETTELSADKARALLSLEEPLDAIFKDYDDSPQNSLDVLVSFIQDKADELLSTNQANAAVQVYPYSGEVAEREGDLEWYRQSHKLNIACKNEIEGAIARNYENNTLSDEAVHQVVAQFGLPRSAFVLVNTIREKDWDGRISHDNKAWAKRVPVYPDVDTFGQNKRLKYVVDCNAGLTDIFVNILRREYRQHYPFFCRSKEPKPPSHERYSRPCLCSGVAPRGVQHPSVGNGLPLVS